MALTLPTVAPFSVSEKFTLSSRWKKSVHSFEYYLIASAIADKKQQHALLLHLAGPDMQEIFETLSDTGDDYNTALEKLNAYFEPQKNIYFECHSFRQASQQQQEPITDYVMRLKTLAATCEFPNKEEIIHDSWSTKCYTAKLRRRLLQQPSPTLNKVISISRALEVVCEQAKTIEDASTSGAATLNMIHSRRRPTNHDMRPKESFPHLRKPQKIQEQMAKRTLFVIAVENQVTKRKTLAVLQLKRLAMHATRLVISRVYARVLRRKLSRLEKCHVQMIQTIPLAMNMFSWLDRTSMTRTSRLLFPALRLM